MEVIFLKILNMSITAGWLVLAVVLLRLLLKKAPKAMIVAMWALVGIRLGCPVSLECVLSVIPSAETIPTNIIYLETPVNQRDVPVLNSTVGSDATDYLAAETGISVSPMQSITHMASIVWIAGIIVMLLYSAISYFRIYRKVCEAIPLKDNIRLCDRIVTPFILGIIHPRIYLPSGIDERDMKYVIAHEKAHLKRHDHWWKPLGFLFLTVYWFNPVLWIAYVLLCRDIELACDEKVIKEMGVEIKKPYSDALINCSSSRRLIAASPLAFGEVGVKGRIKSVLNYKKPAFWLIIATIAAGVVVAVCFLTNPISSEEKYDSDDSLIPNVGGAESTEDILGESIDIRTGDVETFIDKHKNNTVVKNVGGWGYHTCVVDTTGDNYGEILEAGGICHNAQMSSRRPLAVVKITSVRELQNFISKMESVMDFNKSYTDAASFMDVSTEYTEEYFENTTLFLVYTQTGVSADNLSAEYITKTKGVLSIGIQEFVSEDDRNAVMEGYLICISVSNDNLEDIDIVEAYLSAAYYGADGYDVVTP